MRRTLLSGSFLALLVALGALWAFRFECVPEFPTWQLADLRTLAPPVPGVDWLGPPDNPLLRLRVDSANQRVAARLAIPNIPATSWLHLRFRLAANGLTPGSEKWEDGRLMIDWHPTTGIPDWENAPVSSLRFDDKSSWENIVVAPLHAPAVPALRLEHLGRAGEFVLSDLQITAVDERPAWQIGKWLLAFGWLAWGTACVRSWPGITWRRAIGAAAIWLFMLVNFVVPGPWKIQRAMIPDFQLHAQTSSKLPPQNQAPAAIAPAPCKVPIASGAIPALGKMPVQGGVALQLKQRISQARPILHALMLFAPSLAIAFFVGKKPALFLAVILALATELAQIAFGYDFNWLDGIDLLYDASGIVTALWVHHMYCAKRVRLTA
jgi:hypothetical protein